MWGICVVANACITFVMESHLCVLHLVSLPNCILPTRAGDNEHALNIIETGFFAGRSLNCQRSLRLHAQAKWKMGRMGDRRRLYRLGMALLAMLLCLMPLFAKKTWATSRTPLLTALVQAQESGVALGQTYYLPVVLQSSMPWESVQITLTLDENLSVGSPEDIAISTVALDAAQHSQEPQTLYVPIQVRGEGIFLLKGQARLVAQAPDALASGAHGAFAYSYSLRAAIFSFEGKVFAAASLDAARRQMARANLLQHCERYRQALKNSEKEAAQEMQAQEVDRIQQRFWQARCHIRQRYQNQALPPTTMEERLHHGQGKPLC